jgi:hypothetical protein
MWSAIAVVKNVKVVVAAAAVAAAKRKSLFIAERTERNYERFFYQYS